MNPSSDVTRVLFVCVHNAARSRMAEAILRKLGGSQFEVASAGFEPRPADPAVIDALAELDIEIETAEPQPSVFDRFRAGQHFHYVVRVCDEAEAERCPLFPGVTQRLSWSFHDPLDARADPDRRLALMREVRDAIQMRIERWLTELEAGG